ncbi:hypothetical protein [Pseudomonas kuykendallii]|uniref:hypothetical protein n=1 Tax=Pseudomonas kuykendallii TaxID=1007099 RepID=UPI0028D86B16|nr:hypothetical protein [Pseudomonas kuykendallii]
MRFQVMTMRDRGLALSKQQMRAKTMVGNIEISAQPCPELGRMATVARLTAHNSRHGDLLPMLCDAHLQWMSSTGMVLSGVEVVDGLGFAQSWFCRLA